MAENKPKNTLRIKLAQAEAPETSQTDNSSDESGFVYVMSVFCFMGIVGLVLFCIIAYKGGYGFWGWVAMGFGGLNAGGIIGLILGYVLKNILKKGKK